MMLAIILFGFFSSKYEFTTALYFFQVAAWTCYRFLDFLLMLSIYGITPMYCSFGGAAQFRSLVTTLFFIATMGSAACQFLKFSSLERVANALMILCSYAQLFFFILGMLRYIPYMSYCYLQIYFVSA